ncbi:MAG TPA: hypothetical protein PKC39_02230 [Ferruginibacter sp.]|nr:hypothetical protein [Ferruginibacter sp.]HMP19753.1 hypothetical protein [Ferruginibacter sp.]
MPNYPVAFFTEPSKLVAQTESQKFGPVSDSEYRTTSRFALTDDAKAFAVFSGNVMLFDNPNADLVNLIIWPLYYSHTELNPGVRFVIYRGLKREDFMVPVTGGGYQLPDVADLVTPFMTQLYADYNKAHNNGGNIDNYPTSLLDIFSYNQSELDDERLSNIITQKRPFAFVQKGVHLGNFTSSGGAAIDIVLDESKYSPNVAFARSNDFSIVIDEFDSNDTPGKENYNKLAKREWIKNFIDPCVFYHLHRKTGVWYDGLTDKFDFESFFINISTKFFTYTSVYIDIRNNNDYSLNYYQDNEDAQKNHLQIGINDQEPQPVNYFTNYWPIKILTCNSSPNVHSNSIVKLGLKFNCTYNPNPAIYYDLAYNDFSLVFDRQNNSIKGLNFPIENFEKFESFEIESPNTVNQQINIYIPVSGGAGNTINNSIAFLVKLYWLRQKNPENVVLPSTLIPSYTPLDNIFGNITAQIINNEIKNVGVGGFAYPDGNLTYSFWELGLSKKFIPEGGGNDVAKMVQTGVGCSERDVTFFAVELDTNAYTFNISRERDVAFNKKITSSLSKYQEFKLALQRSYDFSFRQANVNSEIIYSLDTTQTNVIKPDSSSFYSLSFCKNEILQLQYVTAHQGFDIFKHKVNFSFDMFSKEALEIPAYAKGRIKLSGMDSNGNFIEYNLLGLTDIHAATPNRDAQINLFYGTLNNKNLFSKDAFFGTLTVPTEYVSDPASIISITKFIELIQKVEAVFSNEDCKQILTRIRSYYYGYNAREQSFKERIGDIVPPYLNKFDNALPGSPVPQNLLGFRRSLLSKNGGTDEVVDSDTKNILISHADENQIGDNPSPYIIGPDNKKIDAGHLFYGLDGLINLGNYNQTGFAFERFQIYRSNDLTGYIADVFTGAAESRIYRNNKRHVLEPLYYPETNDINRLYNISASDPDILSDVDCFGLKNAYDYLSNQDAHPKLSEILAYYYDGGFENANPITPLSIPANYKYRWLNFCIKYDCSKTSPINGTADERIIQYQGFVDFNDGTQKFDWAADVIGTGPSRIEPLPVQILRVRGETFAHFWYQTRFGAILFSVFGMKSLEVGTDDFNSVRFERDFQINNSFQTITGSLSDHIGIYTSESELTYCLDRFLDFVKTNFISEKNIHQY